MIRLFLRHKCGSVSIAAAIFLSVMMVVAAVAIESSNLYLVKLQTQRVSDLANLAAATTSNPLLGISPSATAVATAANIATQNGMGSAKIETVGRQIVRDSAPATALVTTIRQSVPLRLGAFLDNNLSMAVDAQSWAIVKDNPTGDCARSLVGPINIYNNAVVTGPSCNLGAATFLYACHTAKISMLKIAVKYSAIAENPYICGGTSLSPAPAGFAYASESVDPLASDARVTAIKKRLAAMRSPGWTYGSVSPRALLTPMVSPGSNQTYGAGTIAIAASGRFGQMTAVDSTLNFAGSGAADPTCAKPTTYSGTSALYGRTRLVFSSGCYVFGSTVSTALGSDVTFEVKPSADVTFVFKGDLSNSGTSLVVGNAAISIAGNIDNSRGGNLTFGNGPIVAGAGVNNGAGTLSFGTGPFYFNGGTISNGTGSTIFGSGAFYLWGGSMNNASTGTMTFGDGPFVFYGGTVTNVAGKMSFGSGPFEFKGGGLTLNANSESSFGVGDLDFYGGSVSLGGKSVVFGEGGSAAEGGSSIFLSGGSLSLPAGDMTAVGTTIAFDGGTISLYGAGTIKVTAPTGTSPAHGYQNILFAVFGGAFNLYRSAAVTDTMSGISYVPKTNSSIYGMGIVKRPNGGCLQFISGVLDIYQNASLDLAPCSGTSSAADVRLIQ